jgi:hypothetical protein
VLEATPDPVVDADAGALEQSALDAGSADAGPELYPPAACEVCPGAGKEAIDQYGYGECWCPGASAGANDYALLYVPPVPLAGTEKCAQWQAVWFQACFK